jgi:hypothetical protein
LFKITSARVPVRNYYSDMFNLTLDMGKSKETYSAGHEHIWMNGGTDPVILSLSIR